MKDTIIVRILDRDRYYQILAAGRDLKDDSFVRIIERLQNYYGERGTEIRLHRDRAELSMEFQVKPLDDGEHPGMFGGIIFDKGDQKPHWTSHT